VRDHLVFHPHAYEHPDLTHVEPFVVLSALAGVTKKLVLGTATLIPYRHPIQTALALGSLDWFAPGRVIAGWGLGANDSEFRAIGLGDWDRRELVEEQVEIIRKLWTGEDIHFEGKFYKFEHVAIKPVPAGRTQIPMWYGGGSKAAARRAVEYCEGWIPGRMPARDVAERVGRMKRLAAEHKKPVPVAAVIPYVSPGRTVEEAAKHFNLDELISTTAKQYLAPPSGTFSTLEDLDGAAIAGPKDVIIEKVRAYQAVGIDHFVFDFRTRFDQFEECVEMVGTEVLPALLKGDGRA
jgi:alkanesulfonate monooxygenase SsuD/methylene tetrahydromethanopterin reductase-like flavin-dependent oxidoreductase (luciferase family)